MAKTIKFNLICDDKPIRTIEDLQKNFSVEDVLEYYNNGLLQRWLEVRGYNAELDKVSVINEEKPIDIIRKLIEIFKITSDEKKVEESIYILEYIKSRENKIAEYKHNILNEQMIVKKYQTDYNNLIKDVIKNKDNIAKIKAIFCNIERNYFEIFLIDARTVFYEMYYNAPLAIFALLTNEKLRNIYLPNKEDDKRNTDKQFMYKKICELINSPVQSKQNANNSNNAKNGAVQSVSNKNTSADYDNVKIKQLLGKNVKIFAGKTEGYWKDLEPKGKKYMIISMGAGDFVRAAGASGGDLSSTDVTNKFIIIDGIDYKSNSSTRQLLYMEV